MDRCGHCGFLIGAAKAFVADFGIYHEQCMTDEIYEQVLFDYWTRQDEEQRVERERYLAW